MIFPYKINIGTVERNDNRYEEDIVIPKAKNVGPNKISVLGKDIVISNIVISSFYCNGKTSNLQITTHPVTLPEIRHTDWGVDTENERSACINLTAKGEDPGRLK